MGVTIVTVRVLADKREHRGTQCVNVCMHSKVCSVQVQEYVIMSTEE